MKAFFKLGYVTKDDMKLLSVQTKLPRCNQKPTERQIAEREAKEYLVGDVRTKYLILLSHFQLQLLSTNNQQHQ